jgi:hypothetical protein
MAYVGQQEHWFLYERFLGIPAPFPALFVAGVAAAYLGFVYVVCPATRPTTETGLARAKTGRYWHNIALAAFSFVCFAGTFGHMLAEGEMTDFKAATCNRIPYWLWVMNVVFTLSKIWEWADTMFLVWGKGTGALMFLHVYHHTTTFWLYLHMTTFPGMLKMGILLNGLVHTLMYAHYAWPFPKKIVPFITMSQIAQLGFGTWIWHITPGTCPAHASFPQDHPYDFATPYAFAPVYLLFFVKLFVQRFLFGGGKKRAPKKVE